MPYPRARCFPFCTRRPPAHVVPSPAPGTFLYVPVANGMSITNVVLERRPVELRFLVGEGRVGVPKIKLSDLRTQRLGAARCTRHKVRPDAYTSRRGRESE